MATREPEEADRVGEEAPPPPVSEVYACYNGMMLGFFLAGGFAGYLAGRWPVLRRRIHEFLDETGAAYRLPRSHAEFVERHDQASMEMLRAVAEASDEVFPYVMTASLAMHAAVARLHDAELAAELHGAALEWMAGKGIPAAALERFEEKVVAKEDGGLDADVLHSASLAFLREAVAPLPPEADTAFVAMPFSRRFVRNFPAFYQPALGRSGFRALRAWGGLSREEYQPLMLELIRKCGAMLADLTTLNGNVLYEAGYAAALDDKLVVLVQDRAERRLLANVGDLAVFAYERKGRGWEREAVELLAMQIAIAKFAVELAARSDAPVPPGVDA